jgi:hypothetical protein
LGVRVWDSGIGVQGLELRVWSSELWVHSLGFRVWNSGLRVCPVKRRVVDFWDLGSGFRKWPAQGFRVSGCGGHLYINTYIVIYIYI